MSAGRAKVDGGGQEAFSVGRRSFSAFLMGTPILRIALEKEVGPRVYGMWPEVFYMHIAWQRRTVVFLWWWVVILFGCGSCEWDDETKESFLLKCTTV